MSVAEAMFGDPEEEEIAAILVYLDVDLLRTLDRRRGEISRSTFIAEVLRIVFEIGDVGRR